MEWRKATKSRESTGPSIVGVRGEECMIRRKSLFWRLVTLLLFQERATVINRFFSLVSREDYRNQTTYELESTLKRLIDTLKPSGTTLDLIRVGGENDGSYVIPREFLKESTYLISGGIELNNKFEVEVANLGVQGIQIDNSINRPPEEHPKLDFIRSTIGNQDSETTITLTRLIENAPKDREILLKLDIEGAEISALNNVSDREFNRVVCLVLELHNLSNLKNEKFQKELLEFLDKVNRFSFISVFCQANNGCLAYNIGGTLLPDNIEISFIKAINTTHLRRIDIERIKRLTVKNIDKYALINIDHILLQGLMDTKVVE